MTPEQIEDAVFEVLDEVRTGRTEACAQITAYIVGLLAAERADEREACAKIADEFGVLAKDGLPLDGQAGVTYSMGWSIASERLAADIRARETK